MELDYEKMNGLIPAIVQDASTREVLMLGYMNEAARQKTIETGFVTFYSRSKKRLWTKGETSGNRLSFVSMQEDCDQDALLVLAHPNGPVCHKGTYSCFGEEGLAPFSLPYLEQIIKKSEAAATDSSYTYRLLQKGINKVAQKVGEEAVELVIEAKDEHKDLFLGEAADLLYHFVVLLRAKGYDYQEVMQVLHARNQKKKD